MSGETLPDAGDGILPFPHSPFMPPLDDYFLWKTRIETCVCKSHKNAALVEQARDTSTGEQLGASLKSQMEGSSNRVEEFIRQMERKFVSNREQGEGRGGTFSRSSNDGRLERDVRRYHEQSRESRRHTSTRSSGASSTRSSRGTDDNTTGVDRNVGPDEDHRIMSERRDEEEEGRDSIPQTSAAEGGRDSAFFSKAAYYAQGETEIERGLRGEGDTRTATAVGPSEVDTNLFTEGMWEDASCRQVLQAMFFAPDSAIPAGSTEEYKELDEFVPKYLARRAKVRAKVSTQALATRAPSALHATTAVAAQHAAVCPREMVVVPTPPPAPPPPGLSSLPASFHKRYLMNFTALSPEQQRSAQEADKARRAEAEARSRDSGWRGERRERWGRYTPRNNSVNGTDYGETAFRELGRKGVLEREEVKAMLRPGPLQDFRGSVLQAFIDFRMRRSLAKVIKIRRDRASLPIAAYENVIMRAVASNPCVLVAGDTGCGKSTQVPQYLLQAGYGRVACTQPRRISAMGLCRRVSYETLHEHGSEVAYQVRFDSSRRRSSRILFLTEGLLLRQIASDPDLSAYSVVIVDEVHERHAGCDFLLGLLRAVLRRRADLKVVLMSATINPELFSRFFDGAPLIRVPGRMHPVEVRYVPTSADNDIQEVVSRHDGEGQRKLRSRGGEREGKRVIFDARPYVKLLESIDSSTPRDERGDLLVFLSGMGDMLAVSEGVREYVEGKSPRRWVVLMLHSSLSVEEQDKVFDAAPLGTRKMILATNIAETSVTIDGVRFVADSGKAKEMSWDPTSGVRSLQEFWVSRASAEQRKGRAGRTGPGLCFRFYARPTFDRLAPFAEPEIRRCPLEGLVLQMKSLGLDDPRYFPYLSPPPPENLRAALEALALLGATDVTASSTISSVVPAAAATAPSIQSPVSLVPMAPIPKPVDADDGHAPPLPPTAVFENATARALLTPLGRVLSALPVDPSVGKMLALGALFGESEHVLTLAAALSTQTPFDARAAASSSGANPVADFASPDGDPFTVMNAYDEWLRVKAARQESSRRWCKRHGLQEQRLYEITKLRRQFEDLLGNAGLLWLGAAAQRARRVRAGRRAAGGGMAAGRGGGSKEKIRELKMRREGRKRKVLEVDHGDGGDGKAIGGEEGGGEGDAEEARRDLRAEVGEGGAGDDAGLDLSSLEFYMAQDVDQLAESSGRRLARRDVAILKAILCQGLYPQFAVPDAGNAGRASNEQQYVTRPSGGLFMSPSSVLACQDFGVTAGWRGGSAARGGGEDGIASRGAAADAGRGDGLLCYGKLIETQRPFVSSVTPLPALQALLLFSARVDTSEDASLILFDHWLHVEIRGSDPALTGQKLLAVACGLRARLGALLSGALVEAEKRQKVGRFSAIAGSQVQPSPSAANNTPKAAQDKLEADGEGGFQDVPPLLLTARRAWLDGGELGTGKGRRGKQAQKEEGDGMGGAEYRKEERVVDWAQEAEDLAVDLAEFMLQTIGYDVKSVSPRHVEALLVDSLRLGDPAEVRRVLEGHPGLPKERKQFPENSETRHQASEGDHTAVNDDLEDEHFRNHTDAQGSDDSSNMPELLAALSRAIEEEIRGTKGLFGLETGVLERLKSGTRVTPFLRHGSVRRQGTAGPVPHGLAAGGMKKWWRCPKCHMSQVVDLEAIHEHFKVCLVDRAPAKAEGSNGKERQGTEVPKKRRFVGTSVKAGRSKGDQGGPR